MDVQTLIFNNVELLGYNHQNNFFGERSFNYSATKTISLQGFVLDLENSIGVKNIFNNVSQIKNLSQDFYEIVINNQNYGVGKIKSLNFDDGNWVRTTKFNIDIEILEEVPLQSLGSEFASINLNDKKLKLIKSFSETFSLNFDVNNNILGGEHRIEIDYNADNKNTNVLNLAKKLAVELLKTLPPALSSGNYSTRQENTLKIFYTEDYDIINGKCGFSKKFQYSTKNTDKPYSLTTSISINIGEDGIANVTEECSIKAENSTPSLYDCALQGFNERISGAFTRCNDTFNLYKTKFNIQKNLNSKFLQKIVKVDKFNGIINYTINFSNDKKTELNYTWENLLTLDRGDNNVWSVAENGTIDGFNDNQNILTKYKNAENGWSTIKSGIQDRLISFWNTNAKNKASASLKKLNQEISRFPYQGKITYNVVYTDDPSIKNNLGDIKKLKIETIDNGNAGSLLPPIIKELIIPNQTYTFLQNRGLFQQGTFTINLTADVALESQDKIFNGKDYFNQLKSIINSNYNGGSSDKYIESIDYKTDEVEQTINYKTTFKYS